MRKLLVFILAAVITVSLCACDTLKNLGSVDETELVTEFPGEISKDEMRANLYKASNYIESIVNVNDMESNIQDDNTDEGDLYKYWTYSKATSNVQLNMDIDVGGNTISVGKTKVKELSEFNLDIEKSPDPVPPNEVTSCTLTKDNKICSVVSMPNSTGTEQPGDNLVVGEVMGIVNEFNLPFNYNGIDEKSTLKDVVEKIGTPNSMITLGSDEVSTSINLSWFNSVTKGKNVTDDSISIYLNYDAEKNEATISSIDIRHDECAIENSTN